MATKTIALTSTQVAVTGLDGAHAHIRNDGTEVIYAAKTADITAGADGVASIPAGQSDTIRGISGTVYLLGTGSVLIQSDDYVVSPFKTSAQGSGSGADEVARAAINTHSGNAEIHVTAEEKESWNGKADLDDIPASLPANGGNADTVGGKNTAQLMTLGMAYTDRAKISEGDLNDYTDAGCYAVATAAQAGAILNSPWTTTGYYLDVYNRSSGYTVQTVMDWTGVVKIRCCSGGTWGDWKNISDGGNANKLGGYLPSDYVLKSDYDALAARVAALEESSI